MVTSQYEEKILEWDGNLQSSKQHKLFKSLKFLRIQKLERRVIIKTLPLERFAFQ